MKNVEDCLAALWNQGSGDGGCDKIVAPLASETKYSTSF